jgi:hypothetical protein
MEEAVTKKFKGRVYQQIPTDEADSGDIVVWVNSTGRRCNIVERRSPKIVFILNHKGCTSKTKRVAIREVVEAWRWHKKVKENQSVSCEEPNGS